MQGGVCCLVQQQQQQRWRRRQPQGSADGRRTEAAQRGLGGSSRQAAAAGCCGRLSRTHQPRKRQLADQQAGAALVLADLTQRHRAWPEAVRLLCAAAAAVATDAAEWSARRVVSAHTKHADDRCCSLAAQPASRAPAAGRHASTDERTPCTQQCAAAGARRSSHSLTAAAVRFSGERVFLPGLLPAVRLEGLCSGQGAAASSKGAPGAACGLPGTAKQLRSLPLTFVLLTGRACFVLAILLSSS